MQQLAAQLGAQMQESNRLDDEIRKNLKGIGYGIKE
jgi:hypothetical protein